MPYDSQGHFYRVHNWEQDRINEIEIVSDRHDEEDDNFAEGLSSCLLKDGRTAMTGKLNMNNFKIQNVAGATSAKDAVNKSQLDTVSNSGVKLTGNQTIGGNKTFTGNLVVQNGVPTLVLSQSDVTKGTAPSETQYAGVSFRDSTGNSTGALSRILAGYTSEKESFISLNAFKSDATPASDSGMVGSSVTMHYPATGNPYATAPASDMADAIVTTINKSKAANGYFQLGNGLIIQWGKSTATSSSGSVTLPKAFSSTNYAVVINDVMANVPDSQGGNANVIGWGVIQSRSTTAFTAFLCNYENSYWWAHKETGRTFTWIAIGY